MTLRKILGLVLACVMLLSVLLACDNEKPVETKSNDTQITAGGERVHGLFRSQG